MNSPMKEWWETSPPRPEPTGPASDDEEIAKMPSLAKPFAAFGAAAGLFAVLALGSFREPLRDVSPLVPMIATALAGAGVGAALRRWKRLHSPMLAREAVVLWVAVLTAMGGAASGGVVGLFTWGLDGFVRFAFGGALVSLVFVPSCLVVFDAARRAGRGRHGSLVAATDARTVISTVLAGIAFAGATQVPAVLSANTSNDLAPLAQVLLSFVATLGGTLGIVFLERRDRGAKKALEAFEKDAPWLDRLVDRDGEALPTSAVDLGIGADQWSRGSDNYRANGRAEVLVKGSIAEATAAFEECSKRRHRSLVVATCGLTAIVASFALRLSVFL